MFNFDNLFLKKCIFPQGRFQSDGHCQEAVAMNSNLEKEVRSISKANAPVEDGGGSQVRCLILINLQHIGLGTWVCSGMQNKLFVCLFVCCMICVCCFYLQ